MEDIDYTFCRIEWTDDERRVCQAAEQRDALVQFGGCIAGALERSGVESPLLRLAEAVYWLNVKEDDLPPLERAFYDAAYALTDGIRAGRQRDG